MCDLPRITKEMQRFNSLINESFFLISTYDPWYRYLTLYIQTQRFQQNTTREKLRCILHHAKYYLIINDTLYRRGNDSILWCFLTHEEDELVLNDCHSVSCGDHLYGLATTQKILCTGYFWPSVFKDCMEVMKKCPPCPLFQSKKRTHPTPLHPIIVVGPFTK